MASVLVTGYRIGVRHSSLRGCRVSIQRRRYGEKWAPYVRDRSFWLSERVTGSRRDKSVLEDTVANILALVALLVLAI